MSLSPEWKRTLAEAGFDSVHWSEIGDAGAPDKDLLSWAAKKDFVLFTHDLDFGTLLAFSRNHKPSVVQLRTQEVTPTAMAPVIISALQQFESEVSRGDLITIDALKRRARILALWSLSLPLRPRQFLTYLLAGCSGSGITTFHLVLSPSGHSEPVATAAV